MHYNKILIHLGLIVGISSLVISTCLNFIFKSCNNVEFVNFFVSILINIFAGAVILFVSSMVAYFIQREKTINEILKSIKDMKKLFLKIEYHDSSEDIIANKNFFETLVAYKEIAQFDLDPIKVMCDDLLFLFRKNKRQSWIKKEYAEYINSIMFNIHEKLLIPYNYLEHFKDYKSQCHFLRNIQNNIFRIIEHDLSKQDEWDNEFDYSYMRYNYIDIANGKRILVINKVAEHLARIYKELSDIKKLWWKL